jgi:hypothetical protein
MTDKLGHFREAVAKNFLNNHPSFIKNWKPTQKIKEQLISGYHYLQSIYNESQEVQVQYHLLRPTSPKCGCDRC